MVETKKVRMKVKEDVIIKLSVGTVAHTRWLMVGDDIYPYGYDEEILFLVENFVTKGTPPKGVKEWCGQAAIQTIKFKGLKRGTTTVHFKLINTSKEEVLDEIDYKITVR